MKISSMSRRAIRSVKAPKSVMERSTRADGRVEVDERHFIAEVRAALVVVDRAPDLDAHLVEIALRTEPTALDPREDVAADDVVCVGHVRSPSVRPSAMARLRA